MTVSNFPAPSLQGSSLRQLARLTILGANAVILLGLLGLTGWILQKPSLLRVWSDAPAMACETAVFLIVAGVGLLSLQAGKRNTALLCGAFLVTAAAASKLTEKTSYFVSIHRFFPQRTAAVIGTTDPVLVRMLLPAVLIGIFCLFGSVLFLSALTRLNALVLWSTAVASTILTSTGALGIIAILSKVRLHARQGSFLSQMSPVSALAATILGLSLCAHLAARSRFVHMRTGISTAVLGLVSLVLLIAGVDYAIMSGCQEILHSQTGLGALQETTKALQAAMQFVQQAETNQRGFLLTGDDHYIPGYREAVRSSQALLRRAPFAPGSDHRIAEFTGILQNKLDELEQTVALAKHSQRSAALAIVRSNRGWQWSVGIRLKMESIAALDQTRIQRSSDVEKYALLFVRKIVICSFFLSALLIGIAVYLVLLEYRRWSLGEASHKDLEIALEHRVQERTLELTEEASRRELAEVAYRRAQDALHTALDFSDVAVWVWDPRRDSVSWNGPVHRVFETAAQDLHTYALFENLVHPDDRKRVRREIEGTMADGRDFKSEFRLQLPGGTIRWLAGRGRASFENDQIVRLSGVSFDITKLKQNEIELRTRERALQARDCKIEFIFENVAIGDWTWSIPENRIFAHRMIWNLYGSPERLRGAPPSWFSLHQHPADRALVESAVLDAVRGRRPLDIDLRIMRASGEVRWVTCRGNLVLDNNGSPVGMQGLILDITGRKQTELELKEREAQFRHLADAMPQIVWQARPDGQIDAWNARWYELTQWPADSNLQPSWLDVLHPDDRQTCSGFWEACVRSGTPFECEIRLRENLQYRWYLSRSTPVRNQQDEIVRWFGTITDIHEQKAAKEMLESQVQSRTEELRRALREKDILFQEVHHRVKNNLQIITSLLRMQGETVEDAAARRALQESQHRVLSMALIHERLYSREKADDLDLGDYARNLVHSLLHSYSRPIDITVSVQGASILLDVEQSIPCGLILNELITNAIKYAYPKGNSGTVSVYLEEDPSHRILLTVADDGVGLPAGFDLATSRTLGMSIVDTLAHQLGGTLRVESKRGTRVTVSFKRKLPIERSE